MVRRLVHVLVVVLTLIVGAAAAAIIVSQTAWFKNWLRGYIIEQSANYLNGHLRIERLGGNLFFGVEMENVGISMDGTEVVAVKDLGLDYNVFELISSGMSVDDIRLNQPHLYLRREGDTWSITRLIKKQAQEADREGPGRPIGIDRIEVTDGTLVLDQPVGTSGVDVPDRIEQFDAELSFKYEPVRYTIEVTAVSFRGAEPAIGLNELSGHVSVENDTVFVESLALRTEESALAVDGAVRQYLTRPTFELQVSSEKLSLPEIARVVPALAGVQLHPAFELKVNGPMERLGVDMNVRSSAGALTGQLTADLLRPGMSAAGDISVRNLNLAPILRDPAQQTDLTAKASVDLEADDFARIDTIRGTASVDAPRVAAAGYAATNVIATARIDRGRVALNGRASAYGARATARGTVTLPAPGRALAYDLRGEARQLNLSRLPRRLGVPPAETSVNAAYTVSGAMPASSRTGSSRANNRPPIRAQARFLESTVAGARIADGSTVGVAINGQDIAYEADVRVAGANLQRLGREFNVPALAHPRYESNLTAHLVASGRGRDPRTMAVTASGTVTDSTIAGGRIPQLTFDASVANDTAHVKAAGLASGFDPAVLAARPALQGTIGGRLEVEATIAGISSGVTADSVQATGRVHLDPSTIGGVQITSADIDADYRDRSADIRRLEVVGRDVNVSAGGTLALNETGQSNLSVHADSPSLAEIGRLIERPLDGIARLDATITGNRSLLHAKGTLVGSGLEYGENGALTVSSEFEARVPDLAFERAAVDAKTDGTFVTIGGQNINELTATTSYAGKRVDFDATARQPERTLEAAGGLTLHPEHGEVHLDRLSLATRGQQWQLAPGADATVRYGGGATTVGNLTLVNGAQRISAEGTFGRPGAALQVTLTDVDLAAVDALMLRPPQLGGTLNASATVTGTAEAPRAEGTFAVRQGAFRQFRYDSLNGTVHYEPAGVDVDARLQQNATQWITAKGFLPSALFSSANRAAAPGSRIEFAVDSSPIDLGVIQGFTDAVTDVTGAFEAHIKVAGTAADPQPSGEITLVQGAVTVAPTGVRYTNIDGLIQLQPDRVHLDAITLLDNHFNPLSLSGDLAIGQRRLQAMELYINAEDFEAIDNELGEVRIQSALEVGGTLAAPHIAGYLGVTTGNINLDEIIALAGPSPYPTEPIKYQTSVDTGERPAAGGPLDALTVDVTLMVPDDLVVQADSLQAPGAPLSLGALNVTLGGDLRATKAAGGRFRLVGAVNTVRGTYDFQGRRFEILRDGAVRFVGLEELNPTLDLRTRRIIQGVEARVDVRGSLRKPEIILSSTPPLEEADILSLIVFNQPVNQLGEGQQISLAQRAQGLAVGAVAGQLAQSIGQALELDTFEIQVAPESGNAAQLTVGEQLGQNLYLKVEQGVGEEATTNFVLEYELTEWLRLQSNVRQGSGIQPSLFRRVQGSGADLIFFFSY